MAGPMFMRVWTAPCRRALVACPRRSLWRRYPVTISDAFSEMDRQLRHFEHEMSRTFRDLDRSGAFGPAFRWLRSRDVPVETGTAGKFQLQLDVSQFKPEDVKVSLSGNQLTVRARSEVKEGESTYVREFSHSVTLPDDVDPDTVRSLLQADGSLSIEAPRALAEPKEVPIEKSAPKEK
uniref:Putative small heat shock protein ii n=2 Tax=Amblyomma TaxID=6942 RepID=A0A023FQA5_AMBCJ